MLPHASSLGLAFLLVAGGLAMPAAAKDRQKQVVLECVSKLETDADWEVCRALIEAPCEATFYGSTAHLTCLEKLETDWQNLLDKNQSETSAILTTDGRAELEKFATAWKGMIRNRCSANAEFQQEVSPNTALIQCELAEIVGFSAELVACRDGVSNAPFCQLEAQ